MKTIVRRPPVLLFVSIFSAVWLASVPESAGAEPYQGAVAVLKKATEKSGEKPTEAKTTEGAKLKADLDQFSRTAATLSPDAAAKQWLALADRLFAMPSEARMLEEDSEPVSAEQLLGALPPPMAWDALAKAILARPAPKKEAELRELGLRLLAHSLTGDKAGREREIAALQTRAENASRSEAYLFRGIFDQLNEAMLSAMDDPDAVLKSLERRLARTTTERGEAQIKIPNLVALVGDEKASAFIRKALTKPKTQLHVESGTATARLAQKLALELIDQLTTPQWSLVNSLDGVELFEAMDKKFAKVEKRRAAPDPGLLDIQVDGHFGSAEYARNQAETYYFLGLIGKGRAKDAVGVAQKLAKSGRPSLPQEALEAMERSGYTKALDDFFYELLSQDASLPYWDEYVQLAAKAGRTERMLTLARAAANSDDVSKKKRASIHQNLFRALLADGQIDEGVAEMKRMLALEPSVQSGGELDAGHIGIMLAQLGTLLQKPEWVEDGIKAARNSLTNAPSSRYGWASRDVPGALANLLFDLNRGAEAESILAEALAKSIRESAGRDGSWGGDEGPQGMLAALAALYYRAGRPADVIALLESAPYWGVKDLADLLNTGAEFSGMVAMRMRVQPHSSTLPLPYAAAASLAALDRKAEARRINDAVLDVYSGFDPAYELLLKLDAANAPARLDELFARDQFEERPLIWKARLLADRNEHVQAEETVRRAIAIDPSDGEQGPGDRMRAYAVLADIREARIDLKDANFFRGVVKAIRLSEEADKYYAAGLLKRAVAMYQQSLTLFADAYCIQSRLAVQLAELGLHDQAEEHYRRAYELMPDSFGRVESHCFGCERAFAGQRAQSLAEKVFTELAAKQPKKPQVHYLLGYLREEQDRHGEALPHFKTAVTLDPDYLNAWEKMLGSAAHVHLPAAERDQIVFNLLRLDPLRRRAHLNLQNVSDLRGLWAAVENASKRRIEKPTALYPLTASKAALEKKEGGGNARMNRYRSMRFDGDDDSRQSPGGAVAQTAFVQAAGQLLNHMSHEE